MNWSAIGRSALVFGMLLVLHYTVRPFLGWRAPVDFLLIAVLLGSVRVRPGTAAIAGLLVGIAADSLSLSGLGSSALALCLVAFAASWLRAVFFADNLVLHAVFFFFGKWAEDVILVVAARDMRGGEIVSQVLLWSPISAVLTAAVGVFLVVLLRPILDQPSRL